MDYYVFKDDQNIGPLSEGEVQAGLRGGRLSPKDLGCRVGDTDWKDLSFFFPLEGGSPYQTGSLEVPRPVQTGSLQAPPPVTQQAWPRPSLTNEPFYQPAARSPSTQLVHPASSPAVVVVPPQSGVYGGMSDAGKIMLFESGKKSSTTAVVLCLFFGALGIHRFYLGRAGSGAAMLCIWLISWPLMLIVIGFVTFWITPIWAFIDLFLVSGIARQYNQDLALRLGVYH